MDIQKEMYQQFCYCGAIVFNGYCIDENSIDEQNEDVVTQVLSNFSSIFISDPGQIIVKNLCDVDIVQSHSNVFDVYCHKCKEGFRLIIGRDKCYSCPHEDCLMMKRRTNKHILKRPLNTFFPLLLRRFIVEDSHSNERGGITTAQSEYCPTLNIKNCLDEMNDDADFDMMFSSTQNCIVGSFADQWILDPEMD